MRKLFPALLLATTLHAQSLTSVPSIPFDTAGPVLRANAESQKPFTVAGERGVILGQQDGAFEAWVLPVKLLSHFTIEAEMHDYPVPIDVNQHAAAIEVRPDRTIITYSHVGFTVRQIMFSPAEATAATHASTGPIILYEFDCLRPTDFTFRFTPELKWMWPERNEGVPGVEWDAKAGLYVLHSDYPDLAGAITIPGAQPGILAPYQERPQVHPVELKLHIDPARDRGRLFPLLMAVGTNPASASTNALAATIDQLNAAIPAAYQTHAESYKKLLASTVSIDTPDKSLNEAFQWAVISIEQLKAKVFQPEESCPTQQPCHPERSTPGAPSTTRVGDGVSGGAPADRSTSVGQTAEGSAFRDPSQPTTGHEETALVAGYFASADSARPGFGWFFGRDSLYTLYAVNGFGDFALTRAELEFLIRRQRQDGKIMHEYSQTAAAIDWWPGFPYMYAAADSTPLFLMAMADYARASGDTAFLTTHRDAIERAWAFETDPAHDTDHDGIYDNSQGTGWVESWPGGMPHQEIYLALLDQQASTAFSYIEDQLHDAAKAQSARTRATQIAKTINTEYYDPQKGCYAFATNPPGVPVEGLPAGQTSPNSPIDRTTTIYPALAWWDPGTGNSGAPADRSSSTGLTPILDHPEDCLKQFAASAINTDWGTRDIANTEKYYDGMSYHQGSVWPLFTGWAALAEYRANQPLAGYQLLKENANLTHAQDLGAVTELLSGDFFVPFGRSTSHQLWSSAMIITPTLRGLFGISIDAQSKTITVNPHLPANWDHAEIRNLHIGNETVNLEFTRTKDIVAVSLKQTAQSGIKLTNGEPGARASADSQLTIRDHAVQIGPIVQPLIPGNRTQSPRVIREQYEERKLTFTIEGQAGSEAQLPLILAAPTPKLRATGADLAANSSSLAIHFPPGQGWQTITVTLTW
jgi:glycogen debranching enzyme